MFCPNCGKEDRADESYCRTCGLKLDAVTKVVAELLPSGEYAALQRHRQRLEKLGFASLSIAGLIGLMALIFVAALYKLVVFGPEMLFWASAIALFVFLILGAALIGYSRLVLQVERTDLPSARNDESPVSDITCKLIDDRPFEPVPSVTENTTDRLPAKIRSRDVLPD